MGLRALLVNDNHRSWDQKLSSVLFTLRNRKNDMVGISPSVSVFGHETKIPGDWALTVRSDSAPWVPATSDINTGADKSKENRRAFAVGDQVFVKAHSLSKSDQGFHAGFAAKWTGPSHLRKNWGKGFSGQIRTHRARCTSRLKPSHTNWYSFRSRPREWYICYVFFKEINLIYSRFKSCVLFETPCII
jgi:hypothetical protein